MSRRLLAILLIMFGAAAVIGILIWTFLPAYQQYQAAQPPALPGTVPSATFNQDQPLPVVVPTLPTTSTAPKAGSPEELERQAQEVLKRKMTSFAGRVGSYGNGDNFESLRQASLLVGPELKVILDKQRTDLMKKYQRTDLPFAQSTKGLSALITQGRPVLSAASSTVSVQVQQTVESSEFKTPQISYLEWTFGVKRQGNDWLVTSMSSKPFVPR